MRPSVSVHEYMKAHLAVSDLGLAGGSGRVYICVLIDFAILNIRSSPLCCYARTICSNKLVECYILEG
jgi:hypothetical protein